MKILVITQYFYPENLRINDIVFSLQKRGHSVEVITGKPNYPEGNYFPGYSWEGPNVEFLNQVKINRANLLLRKKGKGLNLFLNYLSFVIFGALKIFSLKNKFDNIFIYAPSPITVGILGVIAAKKFKCKSNLWVHDLWPESVKVAGGINNKLILGIIEIMTRLIYRFSDQILVQSPFFKFYLQKQKVDLRKVKYYPYYAEEFYKPVPKIHGISKKFPSGFNLVFAGNIGVSQDFDTIIETFEKLRNEKINLIILGEGRDKKRVQNLISKKGLENKFLFFGAYSPREMPDYFSCADALLITLKKAEIFSYTLPGKLQSYLACGKPIIGAIDGIGRKVIDDSGAGLCSETGNPTELAKQILKMSRSSLQQRNKFSKNALDYFKNNFEKEKLLKKLELILV